MPLGPRYGLGPLWLCERQTLTLSLLVTGLCLVHCMVAVVTTKLRCSLSPSPLPSSPLCYIAVLINVQPRRRPRQHNGAYSWGAPPRDRARLPPFAKPRCRRRPWCHPRLAPPPHLSIYTAGLVYCCTKKNGSTPATLCLPRTFCAPVATMGVFLTYWLPAVIPPRRACRSVGAVSQAGARVRTVGTLLF